MDLTPDRRPGRSGYLAVNTVSEVRGKARLRGLAWELTPVEAYRLIVGPCFYCGIESGWPQQRNGIDRTDSAIGYTVANCVSACWRCNSAKNAHSVDEFRRWVERVHDNFLKGKQWQTET